MIKATTQDAYQLFHDGVRALSDVEANGIKIDRNYLRWCIDDTKNRVGRLRKELWDSEQGKLWRKVFGKKTNLGSGDQLAVILFDHLGHKELHPKTRSGKRCTNAAALEMIDDPLVGKTQKIASLEKMLSTYLRNIRIELDRDGFIHPFFNLHLVDTFRSQSEAPNFQNMPNRDPELMRLVRRCFLPRSADHMIVEVDIGGAEVSVAACYHKDPTMLDYLQDDTKDMHRDMAAECYLVDPEDVSKPARHSAKNRFVFPQFYGAAFFTCGASLWDNISTMNLTDASGVSLKERLSSNGINELGEVKKDKHGKTKATPGSFQEHIQKVCDSFWNDRFPVYTAWKESWYRQYMEKGHMDSLTGFRYSGDLVRRKIINYPVQGSAFHCLLWSLIRANRWTKGRKTKIIGQIHDSIVADVHISEMDEFMSFIHHLMTVKLAQTWKWIITPIKVEAEASEPGRAWCDKFPWEEGVWGNKPEVFGGAWS